MKAGVKKFVNDVEQITFSGDTARKNNLDVLYITERCVLTLTQEGVELTEIAPGVDLEKDILAYMDFKPILKNPKHDGWQDIQTAAHGPEIRPDQQTHFRADDL